MISVLDTSNEGIKNNNELILKYLKIINENTEVKSIIDSFLTSKFKAYQSDCKGFDDGQRNVYLRNIYKEFNDLAISIHQTHNIAKDACFTYFNMDCNLYSKICYFTSQGKDLRFAFINEGFYYPVRIDGTTMDKIYSKAGEEAALLFILNKKLFPLNAQKVIDKAQKEHEQMAFDSLPDLFKAKIFVNKFDSTFKPSKFKPVLKKFGDIRDEKERFDTFHNLYSALRNRYYDPTIDNEKLIEFLDSIAVRALYHSTHKFNNICSNDSYFKFLEKFAHDRDFCSSFSRATFRRKSEFELPIVMSFLVDGEDKENMDSLVAQQLSKQTFNNYVKFRNLPESLKESYFIESKRQFLEDNKMLYNLLDKIGRLPQFSHK